MIAMSFLAYAAVGALAGIMAGLLGISGGVITVPCLFWMFQFMGFPQAYIMHLAIGTSLAAMIFNGVSSAWSHQRRNAVLWSVFRAMAPGIIVGSICGAFVAELLSGAILESVFALFLLALGIYFLFPHKNKVAQQKLPSNAGIMGIGAGIGALSNVLGIGGGIITVPVLMAHHVDAKKAIGTSAATGALISFIGTLCYLYFGYKEINFPLTLGFIYLPAFIVIGIVSFCTAPFGAVLAHRLSVKILRRFFGCALIITGILMFI